ncbi:MAG: lysophospholipid acyltransferase family protein [Myxococcota bacterium]
MARLSSFVRMVIGLAYLALLVAAFMAVCVVLLPSRTARIKVCNLFGHVTGRILLWLCGARVTENVPALMKAHKPALYLSNHSSILDIFIAIWSCPVGTCGVAKKEIVKYPFFGQLYWISGHLRLDRSNHQSAVTALNETAEMVRRNKLGVWMWPEGTRSKDGRLLPLKRGFAHLAMVTRLPIVPVVVKGAHKGWEKNTLLIQPTNVEISVLDPISTEDWTAENLDEKVAMVQRIFNDAMPEDQKMIPLSDEKQARRAKAMARLSRLSAAASQPPAASPAEPTTVTA